MLVVAPANYTLYEASRNMLSLLQRQDAADDCSPRRVALQPSAVLLSRNAGPSLLDTCCCSLQDFLACFADEVERVRLCKVFSIRAVTRLDANAEGCFASQ